MIKIINILVVGLFASTNIAAQGSFNPHFWTGHQVHGALGFIADEIRHSFPEGYNKEQAQEAGLLGTKIILRGNAAFLYGYEYGYQFAQHWFVGGGLEWSMAYPRNFLFANKFQNPKKEANPENLRKKLLSAWLQPLTHIRMGYVFDNHVLLSLGLTYLWALDLDIKMPMNDHVFVIFNYLQWMDGILGLPKVFDTFLAAFDFASFSVGVGYKF